MIFAAAVETNQYLMSECFRAESIEQAIDYLKGKLNEDALVVQIISIDALEPEDKFAAEEIEATLDEHFNTAALLDSDVCYECGSQI